MINNKGFSLIELMVVIAIVALLAAVAVPAYQQYRVKAKGTEIVKALEGLANKAIEYRSEHGVFPTAYDLGLSSTQFQQQVDTPSDILPAEYFTIVGTGITISNNDPGSCGAYGSVSINVDAYALGIPGAEPTNSILFTTIELYNIDGIIQSLRRYSGENYVSGDALVGDFIPGMNNYYIDDSHSINPAEANVWVPYEAAATCGS